MVARTDGSVGGDESQPLLAANTTANTPSKASKKLLILVVAGVFLFAVDFGAFMSSAPQTAIFEQIICRDRVHSHDMLNATRNAFQGSDPCKSEAVQGELALILGYKDGLDVLPSMSRFRSADV